MLVSGHFHLSGAGHTSLHTVAKIQEDSIADGRAAALEKCLYMVLMPFSEYPTNGTMTFRVLGGLTVSFLLNNQRCIA